MPRLRTTLLLAAALTLTGCGGTISHNSDPSPPPPPTGTGVAIHGHALAGTEPLIAATVQLFAAGTTGNGSAPTPLSTSALTDSAGAFTIPAGYTCPTAASQLYLVARGGSSTPTPNPDIALTVPLGRCDAVASNSSFVLNEATTAATAWALAPFLSPAGNLGASVTNTTGLANAVRIALSLTGNTTGSSPGPTFPVTATSPAPRINTLANLLNACTANAGPAFFRCTSLLALSAPGDPTPPTDTLQAAIAIVRNPGSNVLALYNLSQDGTAFSPTLASSPADWTLPLTFTGGGLIDPGPLAVDSTGTVWVANYSGVVSAFSATGTPVFPPGITGFGLAESYGLAIDPSDNIWVTNEASPGSVNGGYGSVTVLTSTGASLSGSTGFSSGGLNYPVAIAIDTNSTAWAVDYGNSHLTQLSPTGAPLSGPAGYFSSLFAFPTAIAIDGAHNAWVTSSGADNITRISPDGQHTLDVLCCNSPSGLALDPAGNIWVANYLGDSVSEVSPTGAVLSPGYTGGGLLHPQGIAVDAAGTVWVANFRGSSVTELAGASAPQPGRILSPAAGWAPTPTSLQSFAIAIDASGNLWISNFANRSITELVGLATPTKTPLNALPIAP